VVARWQPLRNARESNDDAGQSALALTLAAQSASADVTLDHG